MQCTECGANGRFASVERDETVKVAGRTFVGAVRGVQCPHCEKVFVHGADLEDFELGVAAELAKDGPTKGEALKYMRKAGLAMRATDLARLLDVAPETLSRWETDALSIPRLAWATVSALVLERYAGRRALLEQLEELTRPKARPLAKVRVQRRHSGAAE